MDESKHSRCVKRAGGSEGMRGRLAWHAEDSNHPLALLLILVPTPVYSDRLAKPGARGQA